MNEKYSKLTERIAEVQNINHCAALIGWDQQTYMPPGAAEERGHMMAALAKISHDKFVSDEIGNLLADLKKELPGLDSDSEEYRIIKVTTRDYEKETCVPGEFVAEFAQVTTLAQQAWMEARGKSDFSVFQPHLEKIVEMTKRYISFFPASDHPYDTLLDNFEPGMKTAEVKGIFDALRPQQVELVKAIAERPQVDNSFLHVDYDEKTMLGFSEEVATAFGYDFQRGRQDKAPHPFTQSMGPDDVRITTRFDPKHPFALLFGTMHEVGHGLYEQGVGHTWSRTMLESGASLGIHEFTIPHVGKPGRALSSVLGTFLSARPGIISIAAWKGQARTILQGDQPGSAILDPGRSG